MSEEHERTYGFDESFHFNEEESITGIEDLIKIDDPKVAQRKFIEWIRNHSDSTLAKKWNIEESTIKRARNLLGITKNRNCYHQIFSL